MCIFEEISQTLQKGRAKLVGELVAKALENGEQPKDILEKGLLAGMSVIGEKFQKNEVFVPEVLIAARAMEPTNSTYIFSMFCISKYVMVR